MLTSSLVILNSTATILTSGLVYKGTLELPNFIKSFFSKKGMNEFDFEEIFGFGRRQTAYMQKPNVQPGDSPEIREAIDLMNAGRYEYANRTLNSIISVKRDARWYYLSALANNGLGNQMMAMDQIQRAIEKEPYNNTYKQVQQSMRQSGSSYNEAGQGFQSYADGMSKMCMSFFMLQCFCTFCRC